MQRQLQPTTTESLYQSIEGSTMTVQQKRGSRPELKRPERQFEHWSDVALLVTVMLEKLEKIAARVLDSDKVAKCALVLFTILMMLAGVTIVLEIVLQ